MVPDDIPSFDGVSSLFLCRVQLAKRSAALLLKKCALDGAVLRQADDIYSELDRLEWMVNRGVVAGAIDNCAGT